jgi:hypothetical protein
VHNLPYDASLIFEAPSNAENIHWPVTSADIRSLVNIHLRGLLKLAANAEDTLHSSALLMSITSFAPIWAFCEKALCVQFEIENNSHFLSSSEIFSYLRGETTSLENVGIIPPNLSSPTSPRFPTVRSAINTFRMAPWWKLPKALVAATDIAGTTNHLLEEYSSLNRGTRFYQDANKMLKEIRHTNKAGENSNIEELIIDQIIDLVEDNIHLSDALADRLSTLVRLHLQPITKVIVQDLLSLRKCPDIPKSYWGGSGGHYASRLISLECSRRGGNVVRADHAGTIGFLNLQEIFASVEFSVASKYVVATPRHAELVIETGATDLIAPVRQVEIVGGPGYSHIRDLKFSATRNIHPRPRVMYLSSFSNSETKSATHYLSQIVYQDWSIRLTKKLSEMPIDLVCKPHPDFRYPGTRHPLSLYAKISSAPFEEVIDDADVFIYDCINSTAFWEIVCTNKKVICIDVGFASATDEAKKILNRRCTMLETTNDSSNRLQIDNEELDEAIFGPFQHDGPGEFRDILIGQ